MSVVLANEDVAYIEVNTSSAADVSVLCPTVRGFMIVAPTGTSESNWPTYGVVMKRNTDNRWLTVCEDGEEWSHADATVACKSCGFAGGVPTTIERSALPFQVSGADMIGGTTCIGNETDLVECGNLALDNPGSCATTFPGVRCFKANLAVAARQLECSDRVVVQAESSTQVITTQHSKALSSIYKLHNHDLSLEARQTPLWFNV
jgi:hypothetical protein